MTFNTKVSREDVDAMYAYLKTVKAGEKRDRYQPSVL